MIGCNGGVWNPINAEKNNIINAFNFKPNETVKMIFEPSLKKLVFK
jgi:hypothetical protein